MESWYFKLTLITSVVFPLVQSECFYFLTGANQLRPGSDYILGVTYLCFGPISSDNSVLSINAVLSGTPILCNKHEDKKNNYFSVTSGLIKSHSTVLLPIKTQHNWKTGSYVLKVNGKAGSMIFQRTLNVGFNQKQSSLFIQTDKGIYQAGQTVHIRVISLNSDLMPFDNQSLLLYINDGNGNKIKQWNSNIYKPGIFEAKLQLSTRPVLGSWIIQANIQQTSATASFIVQKYDLLRFQVIVQVPNYITFNTEQFNISISANYKNGQPVKGIYILNVSQAYCYSSANCQTTPVIIEGNLTGTTTAVVLTKDLNLGNDHLYGMLMNVRARVIEEFTLIEESANKTFQVYYHEKQLSINVDSIFKPLLPLSVKVSLVHPDNALVQNPSGQANITFDFNNGLEPESQSFVFNEDGTASIVVYPPIDCQSVYIMVSYMNLTSSGYSSAAGSLSNKFITITTIPAEAKVGKIMTISVKSSFKMENFINYQVVGRGELLLGRTIKLIASVTETRFSFQITPKMAPDLAITVFYVTSCGEIVGDAISISIDGLFRTPLEINLDGYESKPGKNITLSIKSDPYTKVALLVIDHNMLQLHQGNDITKTKIANDIMEYGVGQTIFYPSYIPGSILRPNKIGSLDHIFQYCGLLLATNGLYYKHQQCHSFNRFGSLMADEIAKEEFYELTTIYDENKNSLRKQNSPKKFLPKTWIFSVVKTDNRGNFEFTVPLPNKITTWVFTAFALNSKNGLGLIDKPIEIKVIKPLIVVIKAPYTIINQEVISIHALIFNKLDNDLSKVTVSLSQIDSEVASVILITPFNYVKNITIKAHDVEDVYFLIKPSEIGNLRLAVTANSTYASDKAYATIRVKSEGYQSYFNKAVLVDLRNKSSFKSTITVDIPKNVVPRSLHIQFTGQSNLWNVYNPKAHKFNKLHGMDTFRGQISALDDSIASEIQTVMTFRRSDGSFSFFGDADKFGSTWLTASIMRSLGVAQSFTPIDTNTLITAKQYLIKNQAIDGSFHEKNDQEHDLLGASAYSVPALTAFVVAAFLQTSTPDNIAYRNTINSGITYLEAILDDVDNAYDITIVTYALTLANSSHYNIAFKKMLSFATIKDDYTYWHSEIPNTNGTKWWNNQMPSNDIEATSYALLVFVQRNEPADEQLPLVRWIIAQKNTFGSYTSPRGIAVSVQALYRANAHLLNPIGSYVSLSIQYGDSKAQFSFNKNNEKVTQYQDLPEYTDKVHISATGSKGLVIAQIWCRYNKIIKNASNDIFTLTSDVILKSADATTYNLYICSSYMRKESTGVVILRVFTLSGYMWNILPNTENSNYLKLVKTHNHNTLAFLHFSKIPSKPKQVCVNLTAVKVNNVFKHKNAIINIYRFYDPEYQAATSYNIPQWNAKFQYQRFISNK